MILLRYGARPRIGDTDQGDRETAVFVTVKKVPEPIPHFQSMVVRHPLECDLPRACVSYVHQSFLLKQKQDASTAGKVVIPEAKGAGCDLHQQLNGRILLMALQYLLILPNISFFNDYR